MRGLAHDESRCAGLGCGERDGCLRYRQLGADELAPHGTLPPTGVPVCDTLRSSPGLPCGWKIAVPDTPETGPDGAQGASPQTQMPREASARTPGSAERGRAAGVVAKRAENAPEGRKC